VRTVTNGSRLHLKDFYRDYVDTGVNEIQISFDGATAEVFEKLAFGERAEGVVGVVSTDNPTTGVSQLSTPLQARVDLVGGAGLLCGGAVFDLSHHPYAGIPYGFAGAV